MEALLQKLGLTLALQRAMAVISRLQPCTMGELASFAVVDRTTMTRTVDTLVANGWVDRSRGVQSRREVILTVTDQSTHNRLARLSNGAADTTRHEEMHRYLLGFLTSALTAPATAPLATGGKKPALSRRKPGKA